MTVYVDTLHDYGWVVHGEPTRSCHMFTDTVELTDLHTLARKIGMRQEWFQEKLAAPHYDLMPGLREAAVLAGAVAVDRRTAARLWRSRRALLQEAGK